MKRGQEGQPQAPKLLNRRDIDIPDDLESAWKSCWTDLQGKIGNLSEAEATGYLQIRAGESHERHNEIVMGLLYSVLTFPQASPLVCQILDLLLADFSGGLTVGFFPRSIGNC